MRDDVDSVGGIPEGARCDDRRQTRRQKKPSARPARIAGCALAIAVAVPGVACAAQPLVARATVTITWNTRPKPANLAPVLHGTVESVTGTRVVLRMRDGSARRYAATPREAAVLRALIGTTIAFRCQGP